MQFRIPATRKRRSTIITADFIIYVTDKPWRVFPGVSRGIMVAQVVAETAEIILACLAGNLLKVQQLLANRQASPYDVTAGNLNLLYVSIPFLTVLNGDRISDL